jgi:small subunit ribosomal protein S4e
MIMAHLKRYSMPGFWPLPRKAKTYVTTPMPGPHQKHGCIPLKVIVRDSLGLAENSGEAGKILSAGKVLVDGKVRKEPRFPVGFMDVLEIPELHLRYRVNITKRGLALEKIGEEEAGVKLCRITGKRTLGGGAQQLSLHDGRCMVSKGTYRVGDSLMIGIPGQKILRHFPLKKGEPAVIIAGRNMGSTGRIKDIKDRKSMLEKSNITIETEKGNGIETLKHYVMVGSLSDIPASASEKETMEGRRQESPSSSEKPKKEPKAKKVEKEKV